jgi:hypothetical protein
LVTTLLIGMCAAIAGLGCAVYQLVVQNGKLLLRLNRLEQRLRSQGFLSENESGISTGLPVGSDLDHFVESLRQNFETCDWQPHHEHSVFTQYDGCTYYLPQKEAFMRKYRWMYAVAKTIDPKRIIELGTHAGSSADAYLSASRSNKGGKHTNCEYIGIDLFENLAFPDWKPLEIAELLFQKRQFENFKFVKADFRALSSLEPADMVVVDGAHDFMNALEDMKLATTANPEFIFIDDIDGPNVFRAWSELYNIHSDRIEWFYKVQYQDGGLVVKMKGASRT